MHIFRGVNFFPPGCLRDEAQLSKNPAPQVEVDPRNDEMTVRCDESSYVPQARFCALERHLQKKMVREDHIVEPKARREMR